MSIMLDSRLVTHKAQAVNILLYFRKKAEIICNHHYTLLGVRGAGGWRRLREMHLAAVLELLLFCKSL